MLQVIHLDFNYVDKQVLSDIGFSVPLGTLLHLRGSNGCGKTTLLKLLAGILSPERGEIRYGNQPIKNDLAAYQQQICYVGHKTGVSQLLTARENYRFELHRDKSSLSFEEMIKLFSLQGLEDIPCNLLSVGQRRRVALLRLLMSKAPLWLLDEPLVALDKEAIASLINVITNHLHCGGQVVLTSHQDLPLRKTDYLEYFL